MKRTNKRKIRKANKYKNPKKILPWKLIFVIILFLAIVLIQTAIQNNLNNRSVAEQGNFHLTEELYGSNTAGGINFNVHVKFNFDGCDGDIMLYEGDRHIAGPNGWKGPGNFDYNETWTASPKFIPNDGQSHSISYRGSVNRCPKSPGTLWEEISCSVTYDSSGLPQTSSGDKCEIKNLSEIRPVPFTTPIIIPPSSALPTPINTTSSNPPPRSTPRVEASEITPIPTTIPTSPTTTPNSATIIQFMGIKLGKLASSQPLNILWFIIDAVGNIFQAK